MKLEKDGKFWIVEEPRFESTLDDIFFETSLVELENQFRGGWTTANRPTLHIDREEAEKDAQARLAARDSVLSSREETWDSVLPKRRVAAKKGESR